MSDALTIIVTQGPFFGALVLVMIYVLRHIRSIATDSNAVFERMHGEALERHKHCDEAHTKLAEASNEQSRKTAEVYGRTVNVLDRLEKKLDGNQ